MITGQVNSNLEAQIRLSIEYGAGQAYSTDATLDTGFTGFVSLSPAVVASLGLTWFDDRDIGLVDGRVVRIEVYLATVIWDGQPRAVYVHAIDTEPLVGMKMLAGHEVRLRVVPGGLVWIDVVP